MTAVAIVIMVSGVIAVAGIVASVRHGLWSPHSSMHGDKVHFDFMSHSEPVAMSVCWTHYKNYVDTFVSGYSPEPSFYDQFMSPAVEVQERMVTDSDLNLRDYYIQIAHLQAWLNSPVPGKEYAV
jgi:hypothetical protein